MATPPPPPPPPPPSYGRGLHGAFAAAAAGAASPNRSMLLTPSALAAASRTHALVPGSDDSPATIAPAPSHLADFYINQHVPLVLNLNPPNFSQWRTLFEVTFRKTDVLSHITASPRPNDPVWLQDDAYVISWLYNRISPEIFGLVHQRDATAAEVWAAISSIFLENREHQAVFLATDFRRIEQGAGSVLSYFARLKDCADRLADLGTPVTDREQVLNMFRGLHPRLRYAIPILTMQTPFPSFLRCRAFLLLEESRQAPESPHETALYAARSPPSTNTGGGSSGGSNSRRSGGNGGRNKGKAKVSDGGGASSSTPRPPGPSAPTSTPWTGMVHAWPMPWRPHAPGAGVLGPRPDAHAPFAGHASHYGGPLPVPHGAPPPTWTPGATPPHPLYGLPSPGASPSSSPAWDQSALIHALNGLGLQQQQGSSGGEWYLDTGASTHMASSSGSKDEAGDPPV
ncbi:uncharacterized protein [Triticum aestivum]|uniref:uncharacterized protein n=1 Tax=Triticum aestivum TaxID=4565 RepID=UPI001D01F25D|nr:uncharacterized protein LOC123133623 [Triticum aestivum]